MGYPGINQADDPPSAPHPRRAIADASEFVRVIHRPATLTREAIIWPARKRNVLRRHRCCLACHHWDRVDLGNCCERLVQAQRHRGGQPLGRVQHAAPSPLWTPGHRHHAGAAQQRRPISLVSRAVLSVMSSAVQRNAWCGFAGAQGPDGAFGVIEVGVLEEFG